MRRVGESWIRGCYLGFGIAILRTGRMEERGNGVRVLRVVIWVHLSVDQNKFHHQPYPQSDVNININNQTKQQREARDGLIKRKREAGWRGEARQGAERVHRCAAARQNGTRAR